MSDKIVRSIGERAAENAVEVAWAQWSSLTAAAVPAGQARVWTIIDPEALVLLSLAVRDRERRLDDLLAGWARIGSSLLSIQRLKTQAKEYPQAVREQVSDFARYAADAGDRRWRSHAADDRNEILSPGPRGKDIGPLRLTKGPALMLRLRAGIGVGAKADLLTFLLGLDGAAADLKTIALASGYSGRAVRTAAEEMALARFIQEIEGSLSMYRVDPGAWARVLVDTGPEVSSGVPPWHFWSLVFAFLVAVIDWERRADREGWSSYVASSRARDLMEANRRLLRYTNWGVMTNDARGAAYLDGFSGIVDAIVAWSRRSLTG